MKVPPVGELTVIRCADGLLYEGPLERVIRGTFVAIAYGPSELWGMCVALTASERQMEPIHRFADPLPENVAEIEVPPGSGLRIQGVVLVTHPVFGEVTIRGLTGPRRGKLIRPAMETLRPRLRPAER